LVSVLQVLLQTGRLRVSSALAEAQTLANELVQFRLKLTPKGHDSYEAWREGDHDDCVLAVAMACWVGERMRPQMTLRHRPRPMPPRSEIEGVGTRTHV
jgi:hypothetical protein